MNGAVAVKASPRSCGAAQRYAVQARPDEPRQNEFFRAGVRTGLFFRQLYSTADSSNARPDDRSDGVEMLAGAAL